MMDGSGFNGRVLLHGLHGSRLSALTARLLPVSALWETPLDDKPPSISKRFMDTTAPTQPRSGKSYAAALAFRAFDLQKLKR